MMQAPKGYYYLEMYVSGSNVSRVQVLVCERCGLVTGNTDQHNKWHTTNQELRPIGG